MMMRKSIAIAAVMMVSFAGQSFAEVGKTKTNIGVQRICTTKVMCVLGNGQVLDPNTPAGYSCNGGHAQAVTTCQQPPRR